jgi:hypothetical protein
MPVSPGFERIDVSNRSAQWFYFGCAGSTTIIHVTPNRSVATPNFDEKNVLVSGAQTLPPFPLSAANARSACASLFAVIDSETPSKFAFPWQWQSEAITVESPIRRLACITFFSDPGGIIPTAGFSGLSLNRSSIVTSAPIALL